MRFPKDIWVHGDKKFKGKCAHERQEGIAFFTWLRYQHPHLGRVGLHIRNEAKRSKWQTWKQKCEGMVVGASDIIIPCNPMLPGSPPFVCEMKRRDHTLCTLTGEQEAYLRECKAGGAFVCIALGADGAIEAVGKWLDYSRKRMES